MILRLGRKFWPVPLGVIPFDSSNVTASRLQAQDYFRRKLLSAILGAALAPVAHVLPRPC